MSDDLVKRMNNVRDFPANTCGASRHTAMIAEALCNGEEYPMLADEPEYCGESIAATVAALWECRTKLAKAERAADRIEALEAQLAAREWQPIETAPRDGTFIDLWTLRGTYYSDRWQRYPDMWFAAGLNKWRNAKGDLVINPDLPTHWMPFPEPPKAD